MQSSDFQGSYLLNSSDLQGRYTSSSQRQVSNFEWCLGSVSGTCDETLVERTLAPPEVGQWVNSSDGSSELKTAVAADGISKLTSFMASAALTAGTDRLDCDGMVAIFI